MAWYRAGTVAVANGSATVTGAGTDFVANVGIGDAFAGPDGRSYEIAGVVSATQLTLANPYLGGTAGGQGYAIQPTQSYLRDLALGAATLLNTFGAVRDGIGAGLLTAGTAATPALRFMGDSDTGIYSVGANRLGISCGGRASWFEPSTLVLASPGYNQNQTGADRSYGAVRFLDPNGSFVVASIDAMQPNSTYQDAGALAFGTSTAGGNSVERARIDAAGNFLIGTASSSAFGGAHRISKVATEGSTVLSIDGNTAYSAVFFAVGVAGYAASAGAAFFGKHSATGRSINAGGTINASGADYAEYMTKADGCGTIAAGDACGVDADGKLTKTWANAISFVVKSTDPAYVGGDSWAVHLPPRPEAPGSEPTEPPPPGPMPDAADEAALMAWQEMAVGYPVRVGEYQARHAEWTEAVAAYDHDLPIWEAQLEAERVKVDRIAFAGQVPVNLIGDFAVGDYLIASANGVGIKALAVSAADITFDQYRRRLGKVWAIRDGRPWMDVQHG